MVAAIKSVAWPRSNRNRWPRCIGICTANRWTPLSSRPCLPYVGDFANGRAPWLHGHYPASSLLRTQPPPSRLRPTSRFGRLYGLPCSGDFSPGRGGLLQLLGMPLSPCCRFHPAEVTSRIGQISAVHVAFALRMQARPSGILTFEATTRSLLLRPGDSWSPLGRPCR